VDIRIGIIDSGINPWHSHVGSIEGGIAFNLESDRKVVSSPDFRDELGHGTAIAGIIREKAPYAKLYAVKIFHESLTAPLLVLEAALEWAINERMKIIHLSLGIACTEERGKIGRLCEEACKKNIIIVAAARNPDDVIVPASLETVIGVYWLREADRDFLAYNPGKKIEFGACGWPRPLPGYPAGYNYSGGSFAAAHVTGKVAQVLKENPTGDVSWVKGMLSKTPARGEQKSEVC
jgi:subtilisin family serine protease